ncbi:hypothetical protein [Haliscomenobacter sp.]|uniref:hypothetical protein n=1 Tax=Haliscomenobacter sp. TaxID=2717303 RepID=UPI003BA929AA
MKNKLLLFFCTLIWYCPVFNTEGDLEQNIFANFVLNRTPMPQCLSAENYSLTLRYAQWKLKTAKRLSKNRRVLLGKGFEYTVREEADGEKSIVFYKKNVEAFAVNAQALLPLNPTTDTTQYHQLFCNLLDSAKFANLPHNLVYRYHDGANNVWSIGPKKIVYYPVTPAMSSTGTYSGGEPFEKNISETQFTEIETLLKVGVAHKTIHENSRLKGSGMIVELLTDVLVGSTYLLPMRSGEKEAIETWLGQLKK